MASTTEAAAAAADRNQATMSAVDDAVIYHDEEYESDSESNSHSEAASENGDEGSDQAGEAGDGEDDDGQDADDEESEADDDDPPQPACTTPTCSDGWLPSISDLQAAATDYTVPTSLSHEPVCPTCVGTDLMKEHQALRADLEAFSFVDLGRVVEFTGRLNVRRTALGYEFKQLDEREWGYHFDDMLSDDEGQGQDDSGQYEQWAEAMDPNANITARPVPQAVIDALPRKVYATVKSDIQNECLVCRFAIVDEQVVVELACGHLFCEGECIELWLKQSDSCPTCRAKVTTSAVTEGESEPDNAAAGDAKGDKVEDMVENLGLEEEKDVTAGMPGAWGDGAAMVDSA